MTNKVYISSFLQFMESFSYYKKLKNLLILKKKPDNPLKKKNRE